MSNTHHLLQPTTKTSEMKEANATNQTGWEKALRTKQRKEQNNPHQQQEHGT
eukprot:m.356000 g.356000  ORF g.356000 m.356000 type:complete len:52 (-) comp17411_c0_seq1:1104-1259(-)